MAFFQSAVASHACANVLLHLALLIPPSSLSHTCLASIFLPLIWSCHLYSWKSGFGFLSAVHALWSADLLLFRQPREFFRLIRHKSNVTFHITDGKEDEGILERQPYPRSLGARFWWVTKLVASPRYVGWDTGPDAKPRLLSVKYGAPSKWKWLLCNGLKAVFCFLIVDAVNAYKLRDPYFLGFADIDSTLPYAVVSILGRHLTMAISPRLFRLFLFAVQQYSVFSLIWAILVALSVSFTTIARGDDFWGVMDNIQPLWGNPIVVFESGLRGFWGKFWHQLFRHMFADPGKALASALGVPKRSGVGYGIQLGVAFFLSGVLHASTLPPNMPYTSPFRYASFFWLNGVCVGVELLASHIFERFDLNRQVWTKNVLMGVRMIWTCSVLYITGPLLADEVTKIYLELGAAPVLLFPAPQD